MSALHWWIHLTHPGGETSCSFQGPRVEAERKAATYIGKPASWNVNKRPWEPNEWDRYTVWRLEEVVGRALTEGEGERA